ncbi:hypothetical protein OSTOST_10489, partial [Ostertagia ostertagi]
HETSIDPSPVHSKSSVTTTPGPIIGQFCGRRSNVSDLSFEHNECFDVVVAHRCHPSTATSCKRIQTSLERFSSDGWSSMLGWA